MRQRDWTKGNDCNRQPTEFRMNFATTHQTLCKLHAYTHPLGK